MRATSTPLDNIAATARGSASRMKVPMDATALSTV